MPFVKGHPGGPGRPLGSKAIYKSLLKTVEVLNELGRHPVRELVKIADEVRDIKVKKEIWMALLPFIEAPQKDPVVLSPSTPEQSVANAAEIAKQLHELSKPLEPVDDKQ